MHLSPTSKLGYLSFNNTSTNTLIDMAIGGQNCIVRNCFSGSFCGFVEAGEDEAAYKVADADLKDAGEDFAHGLIYCYKQLREKIGSERPIFDWTISAHTMRFKFFISVKKIRPTLCTRTDFHSDFSVYIKKSVRLHCHNQLTFFHIISLST